MGRALRMTRNAHQALHRCLSALALLMFIGGPPWCSFFVKPPQAIILYEDFFRHHSDMYKQTRSRHLRLRVFIVEIYALGLCRLNGLPLVGPPSRLLPRKVNARHSFSPRAQVNTTSSTCIRENGSHVASAKHRKRKQKK